MTSPPGKLSLDDQLCFALYAATNAVVRAYRPLLTEIGLTYPQYLVMLVLWQDGARTVGEIAARLELPGHAISPLLDRLARAGLIERQRTGPDRRVVRVRLTAAGTGLELAAARVKRTVACQTGLDPAALAELRQELRELAVRMTPAPAPPPSTGPREEPELSGGISA